MEAGLQDLERVINADPIAWYHPDEAAMGPENYAEMVEAIRNPEEFRTVAARAEHALKPEVGHAVDRVDGAMRGTPLPLPHEHLARGNGSLAFRGDSAAVPGISIFRLRSGRSCAATARPRRGSPARIAAF
mgnify:CR=1 FL=1